MIQILYQPQSCRTIADECCSKASDDFSSATAAITTPYSADQEVKTQIIFKRLEQTPQIIKYTVLNVPVIHFADMETWT